MEPTCKQIEGSLADLAEGKEVLEAAEHVAACPECMRKLVQLRMMLAAAAVPVESVPRTVVDKAKAIVQGNVKRSVAKLFGSSLTLVHARTSAQDFQLLVGNEEHKVRLMYSRVTGGRWEITGRAPGPDWKVKTSGSVKSCDSEGGFVLQAKGLEASEFSLLRAGEEIVVPSAQELMSGDPG